MHAGDELTSRIRDEIVHSTHFLLLWTKDASVSKWVAKELEFARSVSPPLVILPLLADGVANNAPIDDVVAFPFYEKYEIESKLDTIAKAIQGVVNARSSSELMRRHLELVAKEAPVLSAMIKQLADHPEFEYPQLSSFSVPENVRHEAEFALITLYELTLANSRWRFNIALVAAELFRRYDIGYAVLERQITSESMDEMHIKWLFDFLRDRQSNHASLEAVMRLFECMVTKYDTEPGVANGVVDKKFGEFVVANFDQLSAEQVERAIVSTTTPSRGPRTTAYLTYELFKRVPDSTALRTEWFYWVNDGKFCHKSEIDNAMSSGEFFELMNDAEGYAQFDEVMRDFERCFCALVNEGGEGSLWRIALILDNAKRTRYRQRQRLSQIVLERSYRAEWENIKRNHQEMAYAVIDYAVQSLRDPNNPPTYSLTLKLADLSSEDT